jgi:hypothetical protein
MSARASPACDADQVKVPRSRFHPSPLPPVFGGGGESLDEDVVRLLAGSLISQRAVTSSPETAGQAVPGTERNPV